MLKFTSVPWFPYVLASLAVKPEVSSNAKCAIVGGCAAALTAVRTDRNAALDRFGMSRPRTSGLWWPAPRLAPSAREGCSCSVHVGAKALVRKRARPRPGIVPAPAIAGHARRHRDLRDVCGPRRRLPRARGMRPDALPRRALPDGRTRAANREAGPPPSIRAVGLPIRRPHTASPRGPAAHAAESLRLRARHRRDEGIRLGDRPLHLGDQAFDVTAD